jgi:hypothetical protein
MNSQDVDRAAAERLVAATGVTYLRVTCHVRSAISDQPADPRHATCDV